ncbi:MAG TPA: hypothetical protein VHT75_05575 [Acidimicrobiales bacterium]|jgi:hypothetical protein|nr:hypothetical protein [Acidimicrobiales bacterium]
MLWWIGDAVLLVVIFPLVLVLLNYVLTAIERIRGACDEILRRGVALTADLDYLPENLNKVNQTVDEVAVGAVRYAGSISRLLG